MAEAVERIVNLAFFFGDSGGEWVSAEQVRAEVQGYPSDQDEAAFYRMFERDKDELRRAGLSIASTPEGKYRLDAASTFASEIQLNPDEAAALRAVGVAMLDDPGFPFRDDLRFALAKISTALVCTDSPVVARTADEDPKRQAGIVDRLEDAIAARKSVSFGYTNSRGESKQHEVDPYGLFVRDGRWYLVGRDSTIDEARVYAVSRFQSIDVNQVRPKTPDFERPDGFDVLSFVHLPFQYSSALPFEATVRFRSDEAWRAPALTADKGSLAENDEGEMLWRVEARDGRRLLRWIVENGPGLEPLDPPLRSQLADSLRSVLDDHAGDADG